MWQVGPDHLERGALALAAAVAVLATFVQVAIAADPSTTRLAQASATTVYGQSYLFRATVEGNVAGPAPTGTVQFYVNDEPDGAPVVLAASSGAMVADFDPEFLVNNGDGITARYSGDATYEPSASNAFLPTVSPAFTATALQIAPNPVVTNGTVTAHVTVANQSTGIAPYGAVQFLADDAPIDEPVELDEDGEVQIELVASVPAGSYRIAAEYADVFSTLINFFPSRAEVVQTVTAPPAVAAPLLPAPSTGVTVPVRPVPRIDDVLRQRVGFVVSQLTGDLRSQGYKALTSSFVFSAAGPGILSQRIYARRPSAGARAAAGKSVLISRAARVFDEPGEQKVRPRLTGAGKRLTKRAKRLTLRVEVRFAPRVGRVIKQTERGIAVARKGRGAAARVWSISMR